MTSTLAPPPTPTVRRPTAAARRFGYSLAIGLNGAMLWVAHQLLDWQWPAFLTEDFDQLLPIVSASFVASMLVNAGFLVRDRGRFRALGDLVTAVFGVVVSLRTWEVFPFDFSGYATDWSWLVHTLLVVAIVGSAIAALVNLGKLVTGTAGPTD